MKKLTFSLSLLFVGIFAATSVFAQNVVFLYNKGQTKNSAPSTVYAQIKCNDTVVPGIVALTVASGGASSNILTVSNDTLMSYCAPKDANQTVNLTVGISTVANSLAYDYSYCANKVTKFTTAATPQASYTIDYTGQNPAYQCF